MVKKSFLLLFLFGLYVQETSAQKKAPNTWPGVSYSYARVFVYNLDNQLYGQYHAWKDGKPNFTLVEPGTRLDAGQVKELETVLNGNTQVLNEGLAKCYEPHHAVFYYDAQDKIVAAFDVCFLCEGIRFYPAKKYKGEITNYTDAMTKNAQKQLEQIKTVFTAAGVPVFKHRNESRKYASSLIKSDTLSIVNDSVFENLFRSFASVRDLQKSLDGQSYTIDSSYTYRYTNNTLRSYDFRGPDLKINTTVIGGGKPWITDLMVKKRGTRVMNKLDVGKTRVEVYQLFKKYLDGYFYQSCLIFTHSKMGLALIIHFDEEAMVDHITYYLKH